MIREETVFGPIQSRRFGNSLGINLLPENGKICNFDCIYCECGWNKDGLDDTKLPTALDVRTALDTMLQRCQQQATIIDAITFSGDGEPTINPEFPQIIDDTLKLRDKYYPQSKVVVLSNATLVHRKEIFEALTRVDEPTMKIDAPTNELVKKINNPYHGYDVNKVIESLKQFNGNFVLQTMFLRSKKLGFDSSSPEVLNGWFDIVHELRPRKIMVYTIDRPTPDEGLEPFTVTEMTTLVQPLIDEGFPFVICGKKA